MTDLTAAITSLSLSLPLEEERPVATFDVDESVAVLVLYFVKDVKDRLALSSVNTVWRRAVAAAYATCVGPVPRLHLSLTGPLAAKLTDRRVAKLLECAGRNLRHIEIHGALATFTGRGLFSRMLTDEEKTGTGHLCLTLRSFPCLRTLDVSGCVGVTSANVLQFLHRSKVHRRPRKKRLKKLGLAECDIDTTDVPRLDECVQHDRSSSGSLERFDYWSCEYCERIISDTEATQCGGCRDTMCTECAADFGYSGYECGHCDYEAIFCIDCQDDYFEECDHCFERMCRYCGGCSDNDI